MNLFAVPVRRPVGTSMFFLGIMLLGWLAWAKIPVELLPPISGEELFVSFSRPGSEPEVVEREILLPLEGRATLLPEVEETWGEIRGSTGTLRVRFRPGVDLNVRELELRRVAAEIVRTQPFGTRVDVGSNDLTAFSRFVMYVQVLGMDDRNSLLDFVEDKVTPRLAAVSGVSQVQAGGGATRELTVRVDPDRSAALGIPANQVASALARSVQRLRYLGGVEDEAGRTAVVLDGRPDGVTSLGNMRILPDRPVLLRHVAEIEIGTARETMRFRVNGQPAVVMVVFQEEGANLVRLGRELRVRLDELKDEFRQYGLDFVINFDAAELIETELDRLKRLAAGGFVIALAVLFLFLRQWRAVLVVAVAVPASLLTAIVLLFIAGQSINLVTLFGLAVGIGMLVDNSIVVYEAVQRQLERGADPDRAAEEGVRRTVRAILAATLTNAVVFLPIVFIDIGDPFFSKLFEIMALAILLPMLGSMIVAVGLVPLLARRLAAPAAVTRLAELRERRKAMGDMLPPDPSRELFLGVLTAALRRPGVWVAGVVTALLITIFIPLPVVLVKSLSQEPPQADTVRIQVEIATGGSLDRASAVVERLELAVGTLEGIESVESMIREESAALTVRMVDVDERPEDLDANRVRRVLRLAARELQGVEIVTNQSGFGGGGGSAGGGGGIAALTGGGPARIVLSGPESRLLNDLAREIEGQLESIPEIAQANVEGDRGLEELRVIPRERALAAFGLTADQILPALSVMDREGLVLRTGFTMRDGREIPLAVRRVESPRRAIEDLRTLRLATSAGVLPLEAVADVRRMPAPPAILHHDGRREAVVAYSFGPNAPSTGSARKALDEQVRNAVQAVHRPAGYSVETPEEDEAVNWFKKILVPVLLLLLVVLAVTFESLTLPLLVLVALPLTMLGATWALFLAGLPLLDPMVLMGVVALIGLTVNPAILLVDRMQQRLRSGSWSAGAAALAAVRERTRPVLMTATTTVAGLWPLALITGRENEIWPPFATVVMGGLLTSTLLTLLVIPVGFVFLHRLDSIFGRLGPWIVLGWAGATTGVIAPLVATDVISSTWWQVVTTLLVAALFLGVAVLLFRREEQPEPHAVDGPPSVDVRNLTKVYGRPGPIGRAWRAPERFARSMLARGARVFDPRAARARALPLVLLSAGAVYLGLSLQGPLWRMIYLLLAAALVAKLLREIRRARGLADEMGRVRPGGPEGAAAILMPWTALTYVTFDSWLLRKIDPDLEPELWSGWLITATVLLLWSQLGRRTALRLARGEIPVRLETGRLRPVRSVWRRFSRFAFGLDLPREEVRAVSAVNFKADRGMIGVLGPNGAGKTTLLRMLAGILDPSVGTITIGGVPLKKLRRYLARYLGYLPQDFGLPAHLTAREYLDYYALLYEIRPAAERNARVQRLIDEVGLKDKADQPIGSYSGGMRQRVAVARTLLRLPPVIIVDEPTVGLDPRERIRFRNLLAQLGEGRVVLFSTHVVEDVAVACPRVIVMAGGKIVFDGAPERLANEADGRVWEMDLQPGEEEELKKVATVVDQIPREDGTLHSRVLSLAQPRADASPVSPTLEDGYLWLVGAGARA